MYIAIPENPTSTYSPLYGKVCILYEHIVIFDKSVINSRKPSQAKNNIHLQEISKQQGCRAHYDKLKDIPVSGKECHKIE